MNKCIGCGCILQDIDELKDGYTKKIESNLCERCFRIKNYNDYKLLNKSNKDFENIFSSIDKNDLVILVTDVFHLNIDNILKYIKSPILLVITKRDILPKSFNDDRVLNYINNKQIIDRELISTFKNYNLDELYFKINKYKVNNKAYIVGYTNCGKSTLINKLAYNYTKENIDLTTSLLPSTTLNYLEVKLNDELTLIDTPGIINNNDLSSSTNINLLKKIIPKKEIKPITYQAKIKQYILIDDIIKLEFENANLTIYVSNNLKISRVYKNNDKLKSIKVLKNEDLVIEGVGFIKINRDVIINYKEYVDTLVYVRKAL